MSTNFYLKRKLPKQKKLDIISNIENDEWDKVYELVSEAKEETNIHLGKRSYGWQFLWALNGEKYYKPNEDSIDKFLFNEINLHNAKIVDEYDDEFTLEQFWNEEVGDSLRNGKVTDEDWITQNNIYSKRDWFGEKKQWAEKHKVNWCGNFISEDGLKFCIEEFC